MRLGDMANIDLEAQNLNEPLLGSSELPAGGPTTWSHADLQVYLSSGQFADLGTKLSKYDGRELCFMSERQLVDLLGARGSALHGHLKAERKAHHLRGDLPLVKPGTSSSSSEKALVQPPAGFPPLFYVPSLKFSLIALTFVTISVLLLTVGSESLESLFQADKETIIAYFSIPLISMGFTYMHIWAALYMTFYPIGFIGCYQIPRTNVGFPLGWQGIIPFKAEKMARMAVRLMTEKLIDVKEEFSKLQVDKVADEMDTAVISQLTSIVSTSFERHQADVWALLPQAVKDELIVHGTEHGPTVIKKIMTEVKADILSVFDIESFVVSFMTSNKKLLNRVFIQCGYSELCLIRDLGAVLGFLFGGLQMLLWIPLHPTPADPYMQPGWQSLSVFLGFGLVVGSLTNWLALKIIFAPIEPTYVCGIKFHGLFLQRQAEISAVYGAITAKEVLSSKNIIREMLEGPNSDKLKAMIRRHLEDGCDEFMAFLGPKKVIELAIGTDVVASMKEEAVSSIMDSLPETMKHVEAYTQTALDMENTMGTRMAALPCREFERLLHPVFEEDEWKLVLMGGVLGVVIGAVQAFFIN